MKKKRNFYTDQPIREQNNEEENSLHKVLSTYLPYWPWLLISLIISIICAWIYLKYTPPVYEAKATLVIQDEKKGSEESRLLEALSFTSSKKIVENEIEVLRSRKIMQDVANKLNLYTSINQKTLFGYASGYYSSPISVISPDPQTLEQTQTPLPISFDSTHNMVILNNKKYPLNSIVDSRYGKIKFIFNENYKKDNAVNSERKEFTLSISPPKISVAALVENLKVEEAGKLSSIINLSFRDQIPKRAEDILNQLLLSYRESEINDKNILAENTLKFVNDRIDLVTKDLESIQKKVQTFKSGSNAVDIGMQGQLYLRNVSENDQKLSELSMQISILEQIETHIKNNREGAIPSTVGLNDPLLTQMLTQLNELGLEYEKGKTTIGENNPKILEIVDQINKLKPDILKNITSQQQVLSAQKENLAQTNRSYNAILSQVPLKERELIDITREEQNKRNIYDFLLQKREESEIASSLTLVNNKIVDYAFADDAPVSPRKILIYLVAITLFLGVPLGFLTIKETLNGKVLYRKEIESQTGIPVIGEIGQYKKKSSIAISAGKRDLISEQFRRLRVSISYFPQAGKSQKILVTSGISGEGKSFVAANLAISFALIRKKVIIVDMDLNNPTQNTKLEVDNSVGVSDFLCGKTTIDEAVKAVPNVEGLFLLPAGSLPDNPTELLTNEKVSKLFDYLDKYFEVIIVDTSPIGLVTDGYLLTDLCDTTLMIVRHQFTPKVLVKQLDKNNQVTPIHNPIIVFNGVRQRGMLASKYGYNYGDDYVYGRNNIYGKV